LEPENRHSWFKISWGGNLLVFIISLLLAMVVWGVMKLSASYRYLYHYQVELSSPVPGRVMKSLSKDPLVFRGSSSGFYLLRHKYSQKRQNNILTFKVDPSLLKPMKDRQDAFFLRSSVLKDRLSEMLEGSVSLEEVVSDTLVFIIPNTFQKKVPVCLRSDLTYSPQYMPVERVSLVPDSVLIMGEESIVRNIDSVFTEKITGRNLKQNLQGVAEIEQIPGVEMSQDETVYNIKISRFVERSLQLEIEARNVPQASKMILVPSSVKVTFREEYGRKEPFKAKDITAFVDYAEAAKTESGKAKVEMDKLPSGVLNLTVDPVFVDRIIME